MTNLTTPGELMAGRRGDGMSAVIEPAAATRSKTISWHDPDALGAAAMNLSGRELMQAIADGALPPPPMADLVGARLVSVGDGEVVFRCAPDESTYNPLGTVHGGLLCTMLDFAAGAAVHTRLPAGVGFSSIEIKVSYLKALRADAGEIEIHGRALRVGGRVAFAEAHARNGNGELVGHATSSLAVMGCAPARSES
jgi:uncharacterized protein (TIGR00369 family)